MFKERVIFMGTPEIASVYVQSLIDSHFNIVAVYTQPPRKKGRGMQVQESPVQKLAQKQFFHHNQLEMEEALQNSVNAYERGVCLPSYPSLEDDKIQYVCKTIKSYYNMTR